MFRKIVPAAFFDYFNQFFLKWFGLAFAALLCVAMLKGVEHYYTLSFKENVQSQVVDFLDRQGNDAEIDELQNTLNKIFQNDDVVLIHSNMARSVNKKVTPRSIDFYWGDKTLFISDTMSSNAQYLTLYFNKKLIEYAGLDASIQFLLLIISALLVFPFIINILKPSNRAVLLNHEPVSPDAPNSRINIPEKQSVSSFHNYYALAIGLHLKHKQYSELAARMDFALASVKIGVWEYVLTSGELIWSDEMFSIFKMEKDDFDHSYSSFSNALIAEDVQRVSDKFFNSIENKCDFRLQYKIKHPDESVRTLEATGMPQLNELGEVVRVVGTTRDITLLEENALKVEKLSRVASQTQNLLVLTDCEGVIDWVNDAFCDVTGLDLGSVVGKAFLNLDMVSLNEVRPKAILRKVIQNESTYGSIWKIRQRDGQLGWFDVRCSPMFDKSFRLQGMMIAGVDVTESRKTHRLLARKQAMLEEMSYQGRIGAWDVNILTGDVDVSNMFRDIFELYDDTLDLSGFMSLFKTESKEELRQAMSECIDRDRQFRVEVEANTKSGRRVWVAITGIAEYEVIEGKSVCARLFGSVQDVSAQQNVKLALTEAKEAAENAARIKSQFLANMSHEIRTPMNGVIGMLELMLQEKLTDQLQQYGSLALTSAKGLLSIINDILDYSKIEAGKMQLESIEFNVKELLETAFNSLSFMAERKGLKCITDFSGLDHENCLGDPTRIRQIIINLMGNAIKFTAEGSIGIKALTVSTNIIQISIFDTGIGIPEDRLSQLFSAFTQVDASTTRHFGGSGLGLAITKNLTELMHGRIEAQSELGKGSEFIITLPLQQVRRSMNSQKFKVPLKDVVHTDNEAEAESQLRGVRVLLVDDNLVNQAVGKGVLNKLECDIEIAGDGQQAIELLSKGYFDVVLMDCQMPVMDGFTATAAIRNGEAGDQYRQVPIIALTANAMDGDREKCLDKGMSDYLMKPLNFKLLKEKLILWCGDAVISRKSQASESVNALKWNFEEALEHCLTESLLTREMNSFLVELDHHISSLQALCHSDAEEPSKFSDLHELQEAAKKLSAPTIGALVVEIQSAVKSENISNLEKLVTELSSDADVLREEFHHWQQAASE